MPPTKAKTGLLGGFRTFFAFVILSNFMITKISKLDRSYLYLIFYPAYLISYFFSYVFLRENKYFCYSYLQSSFAHLIKRKPRPRFFLQRHPGCALFFPHPLQSPFQGCGSSRTELVLFVCLRLRVTL